MRLAALASLSLIASASGEYVSMFVERGNVPAFPGTTTYRIFATFDDPGDKVIALAGLPPAFPLEFSSTGGDLIQDDFGLGCGFDRFCFEMVLPVLQTPSSPFVPWIL